MTSFVIFLHFFKNVFHSKNFENKTAIHDFLISIFLFQVNILYRNLFYLIHELRNYLELKILRNLSLHVYFLKHLKIVILLFIELFRKKIFSKIVIFKIHKKGFFSK